MIRHYTDLEVYRLSYDLAMEIFRLTRSFPREELYSLTSQIVRSSRSIPVNIAEGWSKRKHENVFKRHLLDATGSVDETKSWLSFSRDCGYIDDGTHATLLGKCEKIGAKLYNLHGAWFSY